MEQEEKKSLATFLSDDEVKIVWREDSNLDKPPKVGRGKIMNDDDNFVYLSGEKGTVIVNKKDIIAGWHSPRTRLWTYPGMPISLRNSKDAKLYLIKSIEIG